MKLLLVLIGFALGYGFYKIINYIIKLNKKVYGKRR